MEWVWGSSHTKDPAMHIFLPAVVNCRDLHYAHFKSCFIFFYFYEVLLNLAQSLDELAILYYSWACFASGVEDYVECDRPTIYCPTWLRLSPTPWCIGRTVHILSAKGEWNTSFQLPQHFYSDNIFFSFLYVWYILKETFPFATAEYKATHGLKCYLYCSFIEQNTLSPIFAYNICCWELAPLYYGYFVFSHDAVTM